MVFFFNDTATTEIYTLSLHDALPISWVVAKIARAAVVNGLSRFNLDERLSEQTGVDAEIGRAHV